MHILENKLSKDLIEFLKKNEIISANESLIKIEKPGEGNMNLVLRIITDKKSIIIKQSRSYVQKYPSIEAPIGRILVEAEFYKTIADNKFISKKMPKLLGIFPDDYLLVLEDLGSNADFSFIYNRNSTIEEAEILDLVNFLNQLHAIDIQQYPSNDALKKLNHFHIFDFPFQIDNGFDLDQFGVGLQAISKEYKNDLNLKYQIKILGENYLKTGNTLIHGDFYPGSWVKTNTGIKILDPEFGYLGHAEFDLGVFIAHLALARKTNFIHTLTSNYNKKPTFNTSLMCGFAGVEIMRRLLGVAQLPISLDLNEKKVLLEDAKRLIFSFQSTKLPDIEILIK
jgi:5-methylthioribose kinase